MTTALAPATALPPCSPDDLALAMAMRERVDELPQIDIPTEHFFHAGEYVRTCLVPAGVVLCGAVIKIPTVVIVSGHCFMQVGAETKEIDGYRVLRGAAGRAQTFRAVTDTYITMSFATTAESLEAAEQEFTDEFEKLLSRMTK